MQIRHVTMWTMFTCSLSLINSIKPEHLGGRSLAYQGIDNTLSAGGVLP